MAAYDPKHDRFFRSMIALRELPARLIPRDKPNPPPFGLHNFCLLERDETALVYGLIGRFWQAEYGLEDVADGPGFLAFAQPGVAKLALGYVVTFAERPLPPGNGNAHLLPRRRQPTAVHPYWYTIRLVSGLIRRRMLRDIRTASEATAHNHS